MDKAFWREYRRALKAVAAVTGWLIASIVVGYTAAQIDHAPPASAVTPAPSGSGQLGRAPSLKTGPPRAVPKRTPVTEWKPRRQPRRAPVTTAPTVTPTPSPAGSSTPPVPVTSEPVEPTVSPSP